MEKLAVEQDKDDAVNMSFLSSGDLWLEAHNSGKRVREVKNDKRSAKDGSVFAKMQNLRQARKKIIKSKKRGLRAMSRLKFCTPDAYARRFHRTVVDDNLSPDWHMIKGTRQFGGLIDMDPEGEVDLEDYHDEGVEQEEEVESGGDLEIAPCDR